MHGINNPEEKALTALPKSMMLAMLLRQNTTMTIGWIADRLQMGTPGIYRICCIGKAKRSRNGKEGNESNNTKVRPLRTPRSDPLGPLGPTP